jgi:hypothetical protein
MTMQRDNEEQRLSTAEFAGTATKDNQPIERQAQDTATSEHTPLFAQHEAEQFHTHWTDIQASFVDEPQQAVEQADSLVAEVMQRLATVFADERKRLEQQWDRGDDTNTEELRIALRRYRSFFDRLLSM